MRKKIEILIMLVIFYLLYDHFIYKEPLIYENGSDFIIDLQKEPIQELYFGNEDIEIITEEGTFSVHPKAKYKIAGKIVSLTYYNYGSEAIISPIDLCLVWGTLTQTDALNSITYTDGYRSCRYTIINNQQFYNNGYTTSHISNNHIIPANDNIKKALEEIHENDDVYLEGYLVDIEALLKNDQVWKWNTSLIRTDTGCEIIYVKKMVVDKKLIK